MKRSDTETAMVAAAAAVKPITREDVTAMIVSAKIKKGIKWGDVAKKVGQSKEWVTAACLGQMKLTKPQAANAGELFGLSKSEIAMLNETPMRGEGMPMPPTDPLIYRFYELVMVNGPAWKALIEEEFGDGIMSAIDFDMHIERLPNPKGDRVKITMSGKFLPYYVDHRILEHDPFQVLDQQGVGQLVRMGTERGRAKRADLKVGICGEHGGEPSSVGFCHQVGLSYVSCSPYRVPIARLAAAQAALGKGAASTA